MNPSPHLHRKEITNPGCGFVAMENTARAFWQSHMTVAGKPAPLPELADIPALARAIRADSAEARHG